MFSLNITTDLDSDPDGDPRALADLLRTVAHRIEYGYGGTLTDPAPAALPGDTGPIRDHNGNTVGTWTWHAAGDSSSSEETWPRTRMLHGREVTEWACCASQIGPPCQHVTPPVDPAAEASASAGRTGTVTLAFNPVEEFPDGDPASVLAAMTEAATARIAAGGLVVDGTVTGWSL